MGAKNDIAGEVRQILCVELFNQGISIDDISRRLDVSKMVVLSIIEKGKEAKEARSNESKEISWS